MKNIRLLAVFNFLIGFSPFAPLAIIYFTKVSGSYLLGTSIFGLIMISSALFEVPTGVYSDKISRKNVVILGSISRLLAFTCYAIGLSYMWLVIGAVFEGLSRAFYSGNNDAFLYDTLAEKGLVDRYGEYQGKVNSTEQLAMGISAIFSGLVAFLSFHYLLWFSVLIQVGIISVSYLLTEPQVQRRPASNIFIHIEEALRLFATNKKLRLLSLASILSYSVSELKWEFNSAFIATVWPMWGVGIAKTLPSFGASISFYFSGRLIKKVQANTVLLFDSIYGKVTSLIAFIFPTIFSPLIMATSSFFYGVSSVAEKTLMQQEFSNQQRATMSSLNSLGGSLGFALMSLVAGGLADSMGPTKALIFISLFSLPVVYLYWILFHHQKPTKTILFTN